VSLRTILQRDMQRARHTIRDNEHALHIWERQLAALSTPLPRSGIDYAYGAPDLGRLKAAGNTFVGRYLGGNPDKDLTRQQAMTLDQAGLATIIVFEARAQGALGGHTQGIIDSVRAQEQLNEIGGNAKHAPVYFACDWEVQPEQTPAIRDYLAACKAQLGHDRVGIYGGYPVVHELMSLDNVKYGWQTLAWSEGRWSPHAQVRQIQIEVNGFGIVYDVDRALAADFGQWRRT
jgi:hypothetical protein